jgi:uncharacterized protein involved in exopolysaccharide biosynthesis
LEEVIMTTMPTLETASAPGLWRVLREKKRLVFTVVAAFVAFGLALTALTPPVYRATVRVEFPQDPERSPWTGQPATGGNFQSQNVALYTSAELITNRVLLERLADDVRRTEPGLLARSDARREGVLRFVRPPTAGATTGDASPVELAARVERLATSITVEPVAETRLVDIRVEDTDPELARVTADRLAALFVTFQAQRSVAADTSGVSYLRSEMAALKQRIAATTARLQSLGAGTRSATVVREAVPAEDTQRLRKELASTESELAAARGAYRDRHPKVVALAAEAAALRKQALRAPSMATRTVYGAPRPTPEQAVLANELAVDEEIYKRLVARTLEMGMQRQMVVPVVSIVSPAVVGIDPVRPRGLVNLAVCLVAGVLAAVGLALVRGSLSRTIRGAREAEELTGLPVLAVIPRRG